MNYKTVTRMTDVGPYIAKLVLDLGHEVGENDITPTGFHIYAERREQNGSVVMHQERGANIAYPCTGYIDICNAYPCDASGLPVLRGRFAALEMDECFLCKRIEGDVLSSRYIQNYYRVTQLRALPAAAVEKAPITGLVFDTCTENIFPAIDGWQNGENSLRYGFFTPQNPEKRKLPLVVWLHGAGEGGNDTTIAYTGNNVTALSSASVQAKLGGAAWVLAPQSPTVWMDDGEEKLGRSNRSIYTLPLKACIDAFIAAHAEEIDTKRIYITGISNGGFMTVRMLADYPGFFAAAAPGCEVFFEENFTDEVLANLKQTPLWFIHAKQDELVNPMETSVPLYQRLVADGCNNIHFTLFDELFDVTGRYHDELGRPKRLFQHAVWIPMFNDDCYTEPDGTHAMHDGLPVTLWEWMGKQTR